MRSDAIPVPRSFDEIDREWIQSVLDLDNPQFEVEGISVSGKASLPSFLGEVRRVRITYRPEAKGPASLIIKLPSATQEGRGVAQYLALYEREIDAYTLFAGRASLPVPRMIFGRATNHADFVLVLEDVNGRVGDQLAGCSVDEAQAAIASLAAVHATFRDDDSLSSFSWDLQRQRVAEGIPRQWHRARDRLLPLLSPTSVEALELLVGHYDDLLTYLDRAPETLIHGDVHLENIIFTDSRRHASTLVDWQAAHRGNGIDDVAFVLVGSLSPEEHRRSWRSLLSAYASEMRRNGVDPPARAEREGYYRIAAMRSLERLVSGAADVNRGAQSGERGLLAVLAERIGQAIDDLDSLAASRAALSVRR